MPSTLHLRSNHFPPRRRVFPTCEMHARRAMPRVRPVVLWRMWGDIEPLTCAAITTSFGYALGLTLGGELILLDLQPSLDHLVSTSNRLERWLLSRGWTATQPDSVGHQGE